MANSRHLVHEVECDICTHRWIAVGPEKTDFGILECSHCGGRRSSLVESELPAVIMTTEESQQIRDALNCALTDISEWIQFAKYQRNTAEWPDCQPSRPTLRAIAASYSVQEKLRNAINLFAGTE